MATLFQGPSSSHVCSAGGKGSDALFGGEGEDSWFHGAQCRCTHTFHPPPSHAHISLFHGTYCTTYSLLIRVDTATYSYCIPLPCSQDLHHPCLHHNCASPAALSLPMPRPTLLVRHLLLGPVAPRPAPLAALAPNCLHAMLMPTHCPIP